MCWSGSRWFAGTAQQIPCAEIERHAAFFPGPQLELVLASIAEGNTEALLWRWGKNDRSAWLLWDKGNNVFYFMGSRIFPDTLKEITTFMYGPLKTAALQEGLAYFSVNALTSACEEALPQLFGHCTLGHLNKRLYVFHGQAVYCPAPQMERVKNELAWMWPDLATFKRNGFGFVALHAGTVVCWCTAEYVSRKMCGIGIETDEAYQNRGIAAATTARFVRYCLKKHIIPYWECAGNNIPSVRVAEKVGFTRLQERTIAYGAFTG